MVTMLAKADITSPEVSFKLTPYQYQIISCLIQGISFQRLLEVILEENGGIYALTNSGPTDVSPIRCINWMLSFYSELLKELDIGKTDLVISCHSQVKIQIKTESMLSKLAFTLSSPQLQFFFSAVLAYYGVTSGDIDIVKAYLSCTDSAEAARRMGMGIKAFNNSLSLVSSKLLVHRKQLPAICLELGYYSELINTLAEIEPHSYTADFTDDMYRRWLIEKLASFLATITE